MKRRRRHWYHCSGRWHGETWDVGRTCPKLIGENEPTTPRLCVADNVARCFAARVFTGDVFVYRTAEPRSAVRPRGVWDAAITRERWIVPPVRMVFVEVIPSGIVERACGPTWDRLAATKKPGGIVDRLNTFRDALDALPAEHCADADRHFVRAALDRLADRRERAELMGSASRAKRQRRQGGTAAQQALAQQQKERARARSQVRQAAGLEAIGLQHGKPRQGLDQIRAALLPGLRLGERPAGVRPGMTAGTIGAAVLAEVPADPDAVPLPDDVAARLGVPPGTVTKRAHRANVCGVCDGPNDEDMGRAIFGGRLAGSVVFVCRLCWPAVGGER